MIHLHYPEQHVLPIHRLLWDARTTPEVYSRLTIGSMLHPSSPGMVICASELSRHALSLLHDVQIVLCHDVCGRCCRHAHICFQWSGSAGNTWMDPPVVLTEQLAMMYFGISAKCSLGALRLNATICGAVVIAIQCSGQLMTQQHF